MEKFMKVNRVKFIWSFILLFLILTSRTEAFANKKYTEAIKQAKTSLEALMTTSGIPGMSVAVAVNGKTVWNKGFGYANLEHKVAVTPATRFRIGSVSKILTIAAIAKLYEQGRLDLDAPIQKYVPAFPLKEYPITTRQLAGHLAGIRHYKDADRELDFKHFDSVLASLTTFQNDPLIHAPGTKYFYSSFGYNLLSAIIEGASGKDFLTYMRDEIFQPLNASNTTSDQRSFLTLNRTNFYERGKQTQILNAPYVDPSYKWAGGGFLSTAEDLVRFGAAHLETDFLKSNTLSLLFTSQKTNDGKETGVGLGWRIGKDWQGRRILHHAGNIAGGRAILMLYPDNRLVIALLSNISNEPVAIDRTAQMIAEPFLMAMNPTADKKIPSPVGVYNITGDYKDKPFTANLEIVKSDGGYNGWLSGVTPLDEFINANGLPVPKRFQVPDVLFDKGNPILLIATPFGLLELPLKVEGNQISGKFVAGPLIINISGSKQQKNR